MCSGVWFIEQNSTTPWILILSKIRLIMWRGGILTFNVSGVVMLALGGHPINFQRIYSMKHQKIRLIVVELCQLPPNNKDTQLSILMLLEPNVFMWRLFYEYIFLLNRGYKWLRKATWNKPFGSELGAFSPFFQLEVCSESISCRCRCLSKEFTEGEWQNNYSWEHGTTNCVGWTVTKQGSIKKHAWPLRDTL